jgi:hypothetical protein
MIFLGNRIFSQEINWKETKNWRLYDIQDKRAFNYPIDSLSNFKSTPLNSDNMLPFLSNVSLIPIERTPLWMGFYVTTCQTKEDKIKKIEISIYGGFFYDEEEKKYYQLPLDIRKNWLNYLSDCNAKLQSSR